MSRRKRRASEGYLLPLVLVVVFMWWLIEGMIPMAEMISALL